MADINLVDMAPGLKDEVIAGLILDSARDSLTMQRVPFQPVGSFVDKQWVQRTLSDAGFRDIGESFPEVKDNPQEVFDSIALMGNQIDIDTALMLPTTKEIDVYEENLRMEAERLRYTFLDNFINGDRNVSPKKFDGLKKKVTDLVAEGFTRAKINCLSGDSLDLAASSANRQTFLDKINEAVHQVGRPSVALTGYAGFLTLTSVARREGLLNTVADAFGRTVDTYGSMPLEDVGVKADQSTEIITSTENPGDGGTDSSSIYLVRFGRPYVYGMQMRPPERLFDALTDDGVTHRVVWQWPVGLGLKHNRGVVRLTNFKPIVTA